MVDLKISLPLYEGPLDLLLDLIRRQKLDIYDIPIAKVTEQYLAYLHLMEELNVDVASEFLLMAAQLIYIKSRVLLPPDPDAPLEESDLEPETSVGLFDLIVAFRDVLKRAEEKTPMDIHREEFSIEQMMGFLFESILAARGRITLTEV